MSALLAAIVLEAAYQKTRPDEMGRYEWFAYMRYAFLAGELVTKRPFYYILDDKKIARPISDAASSIWAHWVKDHRKEKIVKQENVGNFWISTVFLTKDRACEGPPLLFETMVFPRSDYGEADMGNENECERYSTYAEAMAGHEQMVAKYVSVRKNNDRENNDE